MQCCSLIIPLDDFVGQELLHRKLKKETISMFCVTSSKIAILPFTFVEACNQLTSFIIARKQDSSLFMVISVTSLARMWKIQMRLEGLIDIHSSKRIINRPPFMIYWSVWKQTWIMLQFTWKWKLNFSALYSPDFYLWSLFVKTMHGIQSSTDLNRLVTYYLLLWKCFEKQHDKDPTVVTIFLLRYLWVQECFNGEQINENSQKYP